MVQFLHRKRASLQSCGTVPASSRPVKGPSRTKGTSARVRKDLVKSTVPSTVAGSSFSVEVLGEAPSFPLLLLLAKAPPTQATRETTATTRDNLTNHTKFCQRKPPPPPRHIPAPTREISLALQGPPPPRKGRGDDTVNLHVHRANGDLVAEEMGLYHQYVEHFLDLFDFKGLTPLEPSEEIDELPETVSVEWRGEYWDMEKDGYVCELVWGDLILDGNRTFGFYVEKLGMSISEPVDVIIVRLTHDAASRAN